MSSHLYSRLGLRCNTFKEINLVAAERYYFSDPDMYNVNCGNVIVVGDEYRRVVDSIASDLAGGRVGATVVSGRFGSGKTSLALAAYCEASARLEHRRPLLAYVQAGRLPTHRIEGGIVDIVALLSLSIAARALCALKQRSGEAFKILVERLRAAGYPRPVKRLVESLSRLQGCRLDGEHAAVVEAYRSIGLSPRAGCTGAGQLLREAVRGSHDLLVEVNRHSGLPVYVVVDQFENVISELRVLAGPPGAGGASTCLRLEDFIHNFIKLTIHTPRASIYYALLVLPGMEYAFKPPDSGATPLMLGINMRRLHGLRGVEDVKELVDRFLRARISVDDRIVGPCYQGPSRPSETLFTEAALREVAGLRYPRDIILVLGEAIEEAARSGASPPIEGGFVARAAARLLRGFDPDACRPPEDREALSEDYPRRLLVSLIAAVRGLQLYQESPLKAELLGLAESRRTPVGILLRLREGRENPLTIAVVAGRRRLDIRPVKKLLASEGAPRRVDALVAVSLEGATRSTLNGILARLPVAPARIRDLRLLELARLRDERFRALGCLGNPEDPENALRALRFLAGL